MHPAVREAINDMDNEGPNPNYTPTHSEVGPLGVVSSASQRWIRRHPVTSVLVGASLGFISFRMVSHQLPQLTRTP